MKQIIGSTQQGLITFDIVLPVFNSLDFVRPCLESLGQSLPETAHLWIVDDGSSPYVASAIEELRDTCRCHTQLIRHHANQGYLRSANEGILAGDSPFVVLLNSDTLVFPGTFERVAASFKEDPHIAVVQPVSAWANWASVPFPSGSTAAEVFEALRTRWHERLVVKDLFNASGFFLAVRRSVFDELGLFDEIFSPGYWEEADFCMRVLTAGHRVVLDPDLFVFHHGGASFCADERALLMEHNKKTFMHRWGPRYEMYHRVWSRLSPANEIVALLQDSHWEAYCRGAARARFASLDTQHGDTSGMESPKEVVQRSHKVLSGRDSLYTPAPSRPSQVRTGRCKVSFLVSELCSEEDVHSIFQLVNRLHGQRIDATVLLCGMKDPCPFLRHAIYFMPAVLSTREDFLNSYLSRRMLVVADQYSADWARCTSSEVRMISWLDGAQHSGITAESDDRKAKGLNAAVDRLSEHVRFLPLHDRRTAVIELPRSVNTDILFDAQELRAMNVVVVLDEDVNFELDKVPTDLLERLRAKDYGLQVCVARSGNRLRFGRNVLLQKLSHFPRVNYPMHPKELASILNRTLVLVDLRRVPGRDSLRLAAMACGSALVVCDERVSGVTSSENDNTQTRASYEGKDIALAVEMLVNDQALRTERVEGAKISAQRFCYLGEAARVAEFLTAGLPQLSDHSSFGEGGLEILDPRAVVI